MLIVEGTDLTGKTTLCQKLIKKLNEYDELYRAYQYQHFTRLPPGWDTYWGYVSRMSRRIVQDRFHDSELAYCYGRGETSTLDVNAYRLIEAKLALLGCVKVVVWTSTTSLRARFGARGDDMYGFDVIKNANDWFADNRARFDIVINCPDLDEYPTNGDIQKIVDLYMERQCYISHIQYTKREDKHYGL